MAKKHTTVSISVELAQKIDRIVDADATYDNRSQVVRDAIRQFLRRYKFSVTTSREVD